MTSSALAAPSAREQKEEKESEGGDHLSSCISRKCEKGCDLCQRWITAGEITSIHLMCDANIAKRN